MKQNVCKYLIAVFILSVSILVLMSCSNKTKEQRKIETFVKEYPKLFSQLVSCHYNLGEDLLNAKFSKLDVAFLLRNDTINFTDEMFEKVVSPNKGVEWDELSYKRNLPWSVEFVKKYEDKWVWTGDGLQGLVPIDKSLSNNPSVLMHPEIVQAFKEKWDWQMLSISLHGEMVPWDINLMQEFSDSIHWGAIALNDQIKWNEEIIDEFHERWVEYIYFAWAGPVDHLIREDGKWVGLSINSSLPWSEDLIEKYKDKWGWRNLSSNTGIKWDRELIEKYKDKLFYLDLFGNESVEWNEELIIEYFKYVKDDTINFKSQGFSENQNIPWSIDLMKKYKSYLSWYQLSNNPSLPWSPDLLKTFHGYWDWLSLPQSKVIPWSEEIVDSYLDSWNWSLLSANNSLPMSDAHFFERYLDRWDWDALVSNESLPWSIDFIRKYQKQLEPYFNSNNYGFIQNKGLWQKAFAPYLNDELVIGLLGE